MINPNLATHALYGQLRAKRPFAALPEQQFSSLLASASLEEVKAGSLLIQQGGMDRDYLVLLEGEIEIRRQYRTAQDEEDLEVGRLFPGQGVGEIALLFHQPRSASVRALEYCNLYALDKATFERILSHHPDFATHIQTEALRRRESH